MATATSWPIRGLKNAAPMGSRWPGGCRGGIRSTPTRRIPAPPVFVTTPLIQAATSSVRRRFVCSPASGTKSRPVSGLPMWSARIVARRCVWNGAMRKPVPRRLLSHRRQRHHPSMSDRSRHHLRRRAGRRGAHVGPLLPSPRDDRDGVVGRRDRPALVPAADQRRDDRPLPPLADRRRGPSSCRPRVPSA